LCISGHVSLLLLNPINRQIYFVEKLEREREREREREEKGKERFEDLNGIMYVRG
jgi:hypothetical protein